MSISDLGFEYPVMFNISILTFHFLLDVSLAFSDFEVVLNGTDKTGRVGEMYLQPAESSAWL